jgi:hypothetical protein
MILKFGQPLVNSFFEPDEIFFENLQFLLHYRTGDINGLGVEPEG